MTDQEKNRKQEKRQAQRAVEHQKAQTLLKETSGKVHIRGKLTGFLYELMRDHVTPGTVQHILMDSYDPDVHYTNGFLANYAHFVAKQLTTPRKKGKTT